MSPLPPELALGMVLALEACARDVAQARNLVRESAEAKTMKVLAESLLERAQRRLEQVIGALDGAR